MRPAHVLVAVIAAAATASAMSVSLGSRFTGVVSFQVHASGGFTSASVTVGAKMNIFDNHAGCTRPLAVDLATAKFTYSWTDVIPGVDAGKCAIDTGKLVYSLSENLGGCLRTGDDVSSLISAGERAGTCPLDLGSAAQRFSGDLNSCESIVKSVLKEVADCSRSTTKRGADAEAHEAARQISAAADDMTDAEIEAEIQSCQKMTGVAKTSPPNDTMDVWHAGVYVLAGTAFAFFCTTVILGVKLHRETRKTAARGAGHPADYVELDSQ